MLNQVSQATLASAADQILRADALLIAAGAGMGVDSGLPDFRGKEGFWRAYPPFRHLGLSFVDLANPSWFERDPSLAWGFYGHRLKLYRDTLPHAGFQILRRWLEKVDNGFVFTSNVDGHFQKAGFDDQRILECHGSLQYLQCTQICCDDIWPALDLTINVNPESFRAGEPLPRCRHCNALARPNILMFGDGYWVGHRIDVQEGQFRQWLSTEAGAPMVIIECGAGTAVPTVRQTCEALAVRFGATLVRINPRESQGPRGTISLAAGALDTLTALDALLRSENY